MLDLDKTYSHLLVAIELKGGGEIVLRRARALAKFFGARLSVVHAVEYLPLDAGESLIAAPVDLTQQMQQQAQDQLHDLCQRIGLLKTLRLFHPAASSRRSCASALT